MKATIYSIEMAAPDRIAIVARPRGDDWLCDELTALSSEGVEVLVSMLAEEESRELGLESESENCMEGQHTIEDLRAILRKLHEKIEILEAKKQYLFGAEQSRLIKRIEKAKLQESAILANLTKSGVKL